MAGSRKFKWKWIGPTVAGILSMSSSSAPAQLADTTHTAAWLEAMIGRWDVEQTMWSGADAEPTKLARAIATRRLAAGGGFVDEEMTLATASAQPFTRTSHINYNAIDGQFEYFSIDTRAPQQMHYQSQPVAADYNGVLELKGSTFVAAEWGPRKNAAFAYRVELSPVTSDRQTLRLFLKPLEAGASREFVAFQYEYRRHR